MPDSVGLATDVYLPDGPGSFPVVLTRTPYGRVGNHGRGQDLTSRGYALVMQDVRGKFGSDGVITPLVQETADGRAAIDWIANQKWCNGRIGLQGASYLGIVQVPAASGGHEALRCMIPSVAPGSYFRDWIRYDGCFALANAIRWSLTHTSSRVTPPLEHFTWDELNAADSLVDLRQRSGLDARIIEDWAQHDAYDEYWEEIDQCRMHPDIRIPGLHVGGWFDHLSRGQFEAYTNIRDQGATELARSSQRLLIGPWGHGTTYGSGPDHCRYGDWEFGPEADLRVVAVERQCLDFYLKDIDNGWTQQAPVRVFLMGANRWIGLPDWPPPGATTRHCYLHSGGSANSMNGDGELLPEAPTAETHDQYTHDPDQPLPTLGGPIYWGLAAAGPVDQRPVLERPDVLYYRGPVLSQPLNVVGDVALELVIASSAVDTDFIAKLCVEEPSGAIVCLGLGSLRCRYRGSWQEPEPLTPGEPTAIRLHLGQIAYVFPAGSRVGLVLGSSDFPRINPHPGTMAAPLAAGERLTALNQVFHGPSAPSRLELPVVDDEL